MTAKLSDALTYVLAVCLAASCVVFAGYKVIQLRAMENPPADMGLNFPPPKRKVITDDSVRIDPMTTQAISPTGESNAAGPPLQPYTDEAPVGRHRLMTVIDGVAFVEIATFRGKEIRPVSVGSWLAGAGTVTRIDRTAGRWTLLAGDVELASER